MKEEKKYQAIMVEVPSHTRFKTRASARRKTFDEYLNYLEDLEDSLLNNKK